MLVLKAERGNSGKNPPGSRLTYMCWRYLYISTYCDVGEDDRISCGFTIMRKEIEKIEAQ